MIRVTSVSHYFTRLQDGEALPPLGVAVKAVSREHFRRIDRFVELALLGSGRCAAGRALQPDCGLYMGSGLGPMGSNVTTQEQLVRDRETPMPFDFINILGSSAGFYVARNLKLTGQSLFISRRGANLMAVLSAALADLELGVVKQALVGVVEEASLPLKDHRTRQHLAPDTPVAEGSHWLLLEQSAGAGRTLTLQRFADSGGLEKAVKAGWQAGDRLVPTPGMDEDARATLERDCPLGVLKDPPPGFHDSLAAARVTEALAAPTGSLFLADGDRERGYALFHFGP